MGAVFGFGGAGAATETAEEKKNDEVPVAETTEPTAADEEDDEEEDEDEEEEEEDDPVGGEEEPTTATIPPTNEAVTEDTSKTDEPVVSSSENRKSWFSRFKRNKGVVKDSETPAESSAVAHVKVIHSAPGLAEAPTSDSMQEVAMAGRPTTNESEDMYAATPEPAPATNTTQAENHDVSPVISDEDEEDEDEEEERRGRRGRPSRSSGLKQRLLEKIHLGNKENTITADEDEGNDTFEEARDSWGTQDNDKKIETEEEPAPLNQGSSYMEVTTSNTTKDPTTTSTSGGSGTGGVGGSKFSEAF